MASKLFRKLVEFLIWLIIVGIGFSIRDGVSFRESVIWPLFVVSVFWFVCLYGPLSLLMSTFLQRRGMSLWNQFAIIGLFTLIYEAAAIWFFSSGLGIWPGAYGLATANALVAGATVFIWKRP